MCPSFCPTKTTKHFFPLSCSCSALKKYAQMLWNHAGMLKTTLPLLCFFLPKNSFYLCKLFFSISSICFPLLYLYKKAQTTTFLIKFLRCFFFSFTYFSYFSWVWRLFYFLTFFLQGLRKANSRVWRGPDWLIFAMCDEAGELLMHKAIFPWVMWHHTADPIGGFLWVSFVAFTS